MKKEEDQTTSLYCTEEEKYFVQFQTGLSE